MAFTLATCFGLGALIGKALGLMDIAYGMSATFLFDTIMIVVFPLLGHWLGLSDAAFGLWAGTAVNDTSSVVATGYVFPWFILGFLAMSVLTSLGLLPVGLTSSLKTISKFLMVAALAAIGLNTNFKSLCRSGAKPMLHGFIVSLLVVIVAIAVEYMIGIAPYGTL